MTIDFAFSFSNCCITTIIITIMTSIIFFLSSFFSSPPPHTPQETEQKQPLSSSSTHHVFPSFSGQDVRKRFLSHVRKAFQRKGITLFDDNGIERSRSIGPDLVRGIRDSRIAIVVLSKNYASSSWCLNELLEIMKCRESMGQIVMTVFHKVDPSHVRKQTGEFGKGFNKACVGKSSELKQRWKNALTEVSNIAGEHSDNWPDEADMIEKIAVDVSNALNFTPSRDFIGLIGMESHVGRIERLLCLENEEVMFIGIWGQAGIGKSTIARALFDSLFAEFGLSYFMENVKQTYERIESGGYVAAKHLQEQLLSGILTHKGIKIGHLGVVRERLSDHKVLIVLDDVDKIEQLEALARDKGWFGRGSRIIVTTQNRHVLTPRLINHIYEVPLPSNAEALKIFCQYAFGQSSPPDGFKQLAFGITKRACNLPLALEILGSSLRGQDKDYWNVVLNSLGSSLDDRVVKTLKVAFDRLSVKHQSVFLHLSCIFFDCDPTMVSQSLTNSDLDVDLGLRVLEERSFIRTERFSDTLWVPDLLRNFGREVVREQSIHDPAGRQFLLDAKDIYDVLFCNTGSKAKAVLGIWVKTEELHDILVISDKTFEILPNLQFLRIEGKPEFLQFLRIQGKSRLEVSEDMAYLPPKLRFIDWSYCPMKTLPSKFGPQFLTILNMQYGEMEELWDEIQPLGNLIHMDLEWCKKLKKLPDLSKATNLEKLDISGCSSLVTLPSSLKELNKLMVLRMVGCDNIESLSTDSINLESLRNLSLDGCSKLKIFPEISRNIEVLDVSLTAIGEVPSSIQQWTRLRSFLMRSCRNLKTFPHLPDSIQYLDLSRTGIEEIPPWTKNLSQLEHIDMSDCDNLRVISPTLWEMESLKTLEITGCKSFTSFRIFCGMEESSLHDSLDLFIPRDLGMLKCTEISTEYVYQASGNSITIPTDQIYPSASLRFKAFILFQADTRITFENLVRVKISWFLGNNYDGCTQFPWVTRVIDCDLEDGELPLVREQDFTIHVNHAAIDNYAEAVKKIHNELLFEFFLLDPEVFSKSSSRNKITKCGVTLLEDVDVKAKETRKLLC